MNKLKFSYQFDEMDCGPACFRMIASTFGIQLSSAEVKNNSYILKTGISLLGLQEVAKHFGLDSIALFLTTNDLITNKSSFPCILHWQHNHYVVLSKITQNRITKKYKFHIADPAHGFIKLSLNDFEKSWLSSDGGGAAMFFEPFEETVILKNNHDNRKLPVGKMFSYLLPFKKQFTGIFVLLILGSLLTLVLPFLTQNLIDKGIANKNINTILTILIAQLAVYSGTLLFEIIRNWLMLYIGTKISIKIISDFLKKILKLPIRFFDSKMIGDFNQRIADNERIENFLTSQSLLTLFSIVSFSIYFVILCYYDFSILLLYLLLTIFAIFWSSFWLKKRKFLDYFRFRYRGENQESIFEMFDGVVEMKINRFEDYKRNEWENIQYKLFKLNTKLLKIDQIQMSGFEFFNQIKNILVTFISALLVVNGKMTLGELLSVSYIIGMMNSPVNQLVSFLRSLQDAKLSLERIDEINNYPDDDLFAKSKLNFCGKSIDIQLNNVSFQYEGPKSPYALKNISLKIPAGKVTAIVGASGSGKTTLLKLLLKFYKPSEGNILYGNTDLSEISTQSIFANCGIVLQDNFIFSDTIKRNIATSDEVINEDKLYTACDIANLQSFIQALPLKFDTKIGASGNGISGGEKQRIAIARAIYKNPHFLFFDEATNALDANNERLIAEKLQDFYKGKTVVIVAHRLSTVKNADKIIVLEQGQIVEQGTHEELSKKRGKYFELVRNQLELGN